MDEHLRDMEKKQLAAAGDGWLKRAIEQRNPRLSLRLAASTLLVYDNMDRKLMGITRVN